MASPKPIGYDLDFDHLRVVQDRIETLRQLEGRLTQEFTGIGFWRVRKRAAKLRELKEVHRLASEAKKLHEILLS